MILEEPLLITLPFVTSILESVFVGNIVPVVTTKGT